MTFHVFHLRALVIPGPATHGEKFIVVFDHQGRRIAWCHALCAGLCSESAPHAERFLLRVRLHKAV